MAEQRQATTATGMQDGLAGGVYTKACFSSLRSVSNIDEGATIEYRWPAGARPAYTAVSFSTLVHLGREHGPLGGRRQAPSVFPIARDRLNPYLVPSLLPATTSSQTPVPSSPVSTPLPVTPLTADAAAPSVVVRLMGLEFWPAAPPRPQKQSKVEASCPDNTDWAVVMVLPMAWPWSRRPPAPALAPTAWSSHRADLPTWTRRSC
jgi:hypothetical protein